MKLSINSVLFLGVGGISMYQLALAFKKMGVKVYGYDAKVSKYTEICKQNGIEVTNKFKQEFCSVDLCVKTPAIKKDNKYLLTLNSLNIKIADRAEVLGWLCTKFKKVIAVAGTHGKSTTASLIYEILRVAGKKVSCHIGADAYAARFNLGDDYLVVEACEYNKSFLKLFPNITVVTNVEREHMDCYGTLFNLQSAFLTFIKRGQKRYAYVENSTKFLGKCAKINFVEKTKLSLNPKLMGEHNMKNISLAVAVCKGVGIDEKIIQEAVNSFNGVPRRYELLGLYNNSKIYIDYAHHPTEVKAFMETFKKQNADFHVVFQPHTFSRTKEFLAEFVEVFSSIKNLIIFKEYSAREKPWQGLSAKELYFEVKKHNPNVIYCHTTKSIIKFLKHGIPVAFVGAGDVNLVAESLVNTKKCIKPQQN